VALPQEGKSEDLYTFNNIFYKSLFLNCVPCVINQQYEHTENHNISDCFDILLFFNVVKIKHVSLIFPQSPTYLIIFKN